MSRASLLTTWGVLLAAVGGLAWIGLPAQLPVDPSWPHPDAASRQAMATELARGVSQAWKDNRKQVAWEQAQVLLTAYPEQPYAQRLVASQARLETAAEQERWGQKWAYQTLEGTGWGRLSQAQIEADPLSFKPAVPASALVVRTGSLAQYTAVLLYPGVALPAACQTPDGCVLHIAHGAEQTPLRLVPQPEGGYRFTDPERLLGWVKQRQAVALDVGAEEPLRFETRGLDLGRMGLN